MARQADTYTDRIVVDHHILGGKPVVRGTRIPIELVLKRLSQDLDLETLYSAYPRLAPEDVKACLAHAEALVARSRFTRKSTATVSDHALYRVGVRSSTVDRL